MQRIINKIRKNYYKEISMSIEVNSEKLYFSDSKAVVIVAKATGS